MAKKITVSDVYDELQRFKDTIDRWRVQNTAEQNRHAHTLYGNGDPGMDERIRSIEKTLLLILKLTWVIAAGFVSYVIVYAGDKLLR